MSDKWWEEDVAVSPQEVMSAVGTKPTVDPVDENQQDEGNWWEEDHAFRADVGPKAVLSAIESEKKRQTEQAKLHEAHQSLESYGEIPHVANQIVTDTATLAERLVGMGDRADEVNREHDPPLDPGARRVFSGRGPVIAVAAPPQRSAVLLQNRRERIAMRRHDMHTVLPFPFELGRPTAGAEHAAR